MDIPIEPTAFDVIVLGTGLPEAIVSAAAAVAGKKVLHLDAADFYGSHWASLSGESLKSWVLNFCPEAVSVSRKYSQVFAEGENESGGNLNGDFREGDDEIDELEEEIGTVFETVNLTPGTQPSDDPSFAGQPGVREEAPLDVEIRILQPAPEAASLYSHVSVHGSLERLDFPLSSFTIDLAGPRLAFCSGPLVDLLVRSGCHNYLEFKALEGCYLWQDDMAIPVPSSRADIFSARMSLMEKRVVSRFFKRVSDYISARTGTVAQRSGAARASGGDLGSEDPYEPFSELLRRQQLPPAVRELILYALALIPEEQELGGSPPVTTLEGLKSLELYLTSMGKYSGARQAFLYPVYGAGELPQAFCRLAAVKGALYVLRRPVDALLVSKETNAVKGVRTSAGQLLFADKVVVGPEYRFPPSDAATHAQAATAPAGNAGLEEGRRTSTGATSNGGGMPSGVPSPSSHPVARCVCITDASIIPGKSTLLLVFPPKWNAVLRGANMCAIRCFQTGAPASVCPRERFIVQFSTSSSEGLPAENLLRHAIAALFKNGTAPPSDPPRSSPQASGCAEPPWRVQSSAADATHLPSSLSQSRTPSFHENQRQAGEAVGEHGASGEAGQDREEVERGEGGKEGERERKGEAEGGGEGQFAKMSTPSAVMERQSLEGVGSEGMEDKAVGPGHGAEAEVQDRGQQREAEGNLMGEAAEEGEGDERPSLLWCAYFTSNAQGGVQTTERQHDERQMDRGHEERVPAGLVQCGLPDETIDYRSVVAAAEKAFETLLPGELFFPSAPDGEKGDESGDEDEGDEDEDEESEKKKHQPAQDPEVHSKEEGKEIVQQASTGDENGANEVVEIMTMGAQSLGQTWGKEGGARS
eukprot:TRINITY_DN705_c0_g2_i1.p1 TRINITY_DN705_c0_g2~~TRINITY_DN705_c0_g2_i1.p1  ORF type:complete len:871 (+),score=188.75 TRINITY_DN705_c0_g2_i1:323-2935(+)